VGVVEVDFAGIRERLRGAGSRSNPQSDVWVVVDGGLGKQESFDFVQAACEAAAWAGIEVTATTGGTHVAVWDRNWEPAVQTIADTLAAAGHDVRITAPVAAPRQLPFRTETLAFLHLTHRLDPPLSVESMGHPYVRERWNVPAAAKQRLFQTAAEWAIGEGEYGGVGLIALVTATRDDVPDILHELLPDPGPTRSVYLNGYPRGDWSGLELDRRVTFDPYGKTVWVGRYAGMSQVERALQLRDIMIGFASELEIGWIDLRPAIDLGGYLPGDGSWSNAKPVWHTYVPDARGIQVLTGTHLALAHDLSGWIVEPLGSDRYLVQAKDLHAWFPAEDDQPIWYGWAVDDHTLDKARADFGNLILTDAIHDTLYRAARGLPELTTPTRGLPRPARPDHPPKPFYPRPSPSEPR